MSEQDKTPWVLSLGPQDTDQAPSPVLGVHVCKAAVSLQQSARVGGTKQRKANTGEAVRLSTP